MDTPTRLPSSVVSAAGSDASSAEQDARRPRNKASPRETRSSRIEHLFAFAIVALCLLALWRLATGGFLPQPFYFHVGESLMDLYTTAYWANNGHAYLTWHSLYPPLSFVFLRLLSIHHCYNQGALLGRICDERLLFIFLIFFLLNAFLVFRSYRWMRVRAAFPRTIAVCFGLPMLYALERGNLLIPCFTCFVLAFGDVLRWRGARLLAMALAINFKPYLVFSLLPFLGRRAWGTLVLCGLMFVAVYGVTFLVEGSGAPLDVIANESRYAAVKSAKYFSDLYFATSYWPLIRLLRAAPAGLILAPPGVARAIALGLEIAIRLAQLGFFACSAVALLRRDRLDIRRFGAMVVCISLAAFTTGSAGYVAIFLFFFLFYEPWRGPARIVILCSRLPSVSPDRLCVQARWGGSVRQLLDRPRRRRGLWSFCRPVGQTGPSPGHSIRVDRDKFRRSPASNRNGFPWRGCGWIVAIALGRFDADRAT